MNGGRQKTRERGSCAVKEGEARNTRIRAAEPLVAKSKPESQTGTKMLVEAVCERENLIRALKRVKGKKGSPGVDGLTVNELEGYLRENWKTLKEQLLSGTYKPNPVKRVAIPKDGGGTRELGIPTVLDRFIQQALLQVMQGLYDPIFSDYSYGFRPQRSAHQALSRARQYISEGYGYVVDIDLDRFFDRVNHDRLMGTLAKRIEDKRMLKIIRAYLNAGVMEDGLVKPTSEGTPQGGNLSPLLSNIVLDELDKELEKRGHRFVRYADDCNIYVRSARAGERVMESITRFITKRLRLKVNQDKSAVGKPSTRKFLGYSITSKGCPRLRIAPKSLKRFKDNVRAITRRNRGISLERMIGDLMDYVRGWMGYYRWIETPSVLKNLDSWIRRRIRCYIWNQWKTYGRRAQGLIRRGISKKTAYSVAYVRGLWIMSGDKFVQIALSNAYLASFGLRPLQSFVTV